MLRLYSDFPPSFLDPPSEARADRGLVDLGVGRVAHGLAGMGHLPAWKKLVFACSFFHATLQVGACGCVLVCLCLCAPAFVKASLVESTATAKTFTWTLEPISVHLIYMLGDGGLGFEFSCSSLVGGMFME